MLTSLTDELKWFGFIYCKYWNFVVVFKLYTEIGMCEFSVDYYIFLKDLYIFPYDCKEIISIVHYYIFLKDLFIFSYDYK